MVQNQALILNRAPNICGAPQRLSYVKGTMRLAARFQPPRRPGSTPLIALHGISRNARALWDAFVPEAQDTGRAVLVPRFDAVRWPQFQRIGKARPDLALLSLIRQAALEGQKFDLFGFSGGAQLAHRFAMLYPHRVATLHLAAPGWYCLPDLETDWPQGLRRDPGKRLRLFDAAALSRMQLENYLSLPVRLWVGANDLQRDASLRQSVEIDLRQGLTRVDRAFRYAEAFVKLAQAKGIHANIKITVLPGCGHDFVQCAQTGGLASRVLQSATPSLTHPLKETTR